MDAHASPAAPLFEAMIVPHRSLSPRGLRILIAVICGFSALTVLRFWLIGAWPVAGFSFVEIGLAVFLLRLNAKRARASELVLLTEDGLRIRRTDMHGHREEQTLSSAWLNVLLVERQGRVPALLLTNRDTKVEVAASLGEDEKRDLAEALHDALDRLRRPRFDNPQLREE
jgi:uncharacterized membrane protein